MRTTNRFRLRSTALRGREEHHRPDPCGAARRFICGYRGTLPRGGLFRAGPRRGPVQGGRGRALLGGLKVELRHEHGEQRVYVNGEDVTGRIRTPEISMAASAVSALPAVRRFLFHLQRDTAAVQDVIMDGRDIGTVVLPDARLKIFSDRVGGGPGRQTDGGIARKGNRGRF